MLQEKPMSEGKRFGVAVIVLLFLLAWYYHHLDSPSYPDWVVCDEELYPCN